MCTLSLCTVLWHPECLFKVGFCKLDLFEWHFNTVHHPSFCFKDKELVTQLIPFLTKKDVAIMFDVFGDVKSLVKLESICIDNNVFRLHYKATFVILVLASLLVTSKQYIGDPIDCVVEEIPQNVRTKILSSHI